MPYDPSRWTEVTRWGIARDNPRQFNPIRFSQGVTPIPAGWKTNLAGVWNVIDCSDFLPSDAKVAWLTLWLVHTHGTKLEIGDMFVGVRRHGFTGSIFDPARGVFYDMHTQLCCTNEGGGVRTTDEICVSLSPDLKFDLLYWPNSIQGPGIFWPTYCAYAVNGCVFGWGA